MHLRALQERFHHQNLLKVHYISDDGLKVRLDIYNTMMHNTGGGRHHGFQIEKADPASTIRWNARHLSAQSSLLLLWWT